MNEINNSQDVIDSRGIIERIKKLKGTKDEDEREELQKLKALNTSLKDNGFDNEVLEFGVTLISDDYFEDYAREFAKDIGAISRDTQWPATYIDWTAAAEALQQDYTEIDFDGATYWARE